jgi:DNA-binding Xre family transcriptional regulator
MAVRLRVKEIALEKGMSQGKLSRSADVDIKTLQRIYRQPTTIVTTETLGKLAKALGVDASELIESAPEETQGNQAP